MGLLGDALAAIEEARIHGYSPMAAMMAAADHLSLATREEAVLIASALAGWIATDLNPSVGTVDLEWWVDTATGIVAAGQVGGG